MSEVIKTTEMIEIDLNDFKDIIKNAVEAGRKAERKEVLQMGTQAGIVAALDFIHKEKEHKMKSRFDRRLRNTKLLLIEYRKLEIHCKDAEYKKISSNAIDILDELDCFEFEDDVYIESIKKSKDRTDIIIKHIQKMLEAYKYLCDRSKKPEVARRYNVIYDLFIGDYEFTIDEVAESYNIHPRTVYKDVDDASATLSALIFGIDGLKTL